MLIQELESEFNLRVCVPQLTLMFPGVVMPTDPRRRSDNDCVPLSSNCSVLMITKFQAGHCLVQPDGALLRSAELG